MRRWAMGIAVMGFFVLAMVGWCAGLEPLDCGLRAVGGAAALFVLSSIAGKIVLNIVVDALVSHRNPGVKEDNRGA